MKIKVEIFIGFLGSGKTSFLKLFSINSIMGFLVVGPMLDVKNTIMLFGSFKKKFVLKLIFIIIVVSFSVLINCKLA